MIALLMLLAVPLPTVPAGYTITPAVKPGLVSRPIVADFDEAGNLFVAEASGTNDPVQKQLKDRPHRVVMLRDTNGDGVFDARTIYADGLMLPQGVMCLGGSVYVGCPPSIWKLTDTTGDGVADRREEWHKGGTLTGCANDLHGPYAGPDGWIYWTKGAFAEQRIPRPGRADMLSNASHVFRARRDGTGQEAVMVGGMDNPVGLAFTPGGERIFSATFLLHPAGGKRDGLAHAVYGAIHGKDHAPIYKGHPHTGPALMPVMTHLGPAAPAGIRCVGEALYVTQFNLRRVSKQRLIPQGSTFVTQDEDFVVSEDVDFHPTDVVADADGSLLVIDTGGWYKLCCPTSQFHKPDILGGIYRVRRKGENPPPDPRGAKIAWQKASAVELANLLSDPRPVVQQRALERLARHKEALPALEGVLARGGVEARRNALWTLARIEGDSALARVRDAVLDREDTVRQVALNILSLCRDPRSVKICLHAIASPSSMNRRLAAETLGRIGAREAIPELLAALDGADFTLTHAIVFALIEMGDAPAVRSALADSRPAVVRGALLALEAMPEGKLTSAEVLPHLASTQRDLQEAAWWIARRHADWDAALVPVFRERLARGDDVGETLRPFVNRPAILALLAERLREGKEAERVSVLRLMRSATPKKLSPTWESVLRESLKSQPLATMQTLQALQVGEAFRTELRALADNGAVPELRLAALAALPSATLSKEAFALVAESLVAEQALPRRGQAIGIVMQAKLNAEQYQALALLLPKVGAMERMRIIQIFSSVDEKTARVLMDQLRTLKGEISADWVRSHLSKLPGAEKLLAELDADAAQQREQLETLLQALEPGDVRRGQAVFHSAKAACVACHAVGYVGGKIGPDLTRIGTIRTRRDLLEAIVYPSASFVRSYEPVQATTKRGQVYQGNLKSEDTTHVVLALSATEEIRLARRDLESLVPGKVSLMPAGLEKQLTRRELADLLAFLQACR